MCSFGDDAPSKMPFPDLGLALSLAIGIAVVGSEVGPWRKPPDEGVDPPLLPDTATIDKVADCVGEGVRVIWAGGWYGEGRHGGRGG